MENPVATAITDPVNTLISSDKMIERMVVVFIVTIIDFWFWLIVGRERMCS